MVGSHAWETVATLSGSRGNHRGGHQQTCAAISPAILNASCIVLHTHVSSNHQYRLCHCALHTGCHDVQQTSASELPFLRQVIVAMISTTCRSAVRACRAAGQTASLCRRTPRARPTWDGPPPSGLHFPGSPVPTEHEHTTVQLYTLQDGVRLCTQTHRRAVIAHHTLTKAMLQ